MKTILTNKRISIQTRKRILQCYIEPILMYGCEAWTVSKQIEKKLKAIERWFLRRMLPISWTEKKSNKEVLEEAQAKPSIINKVRKRQTTFFGHVMRREGLEHLVTTGMIDGKRSQGRQREKMTDGMKEWLQISKVTEMMKLTREREIWRDMITNAMRHGRGTEMAKNMDSGAMYGRLTPRGQIHGLFADPWKISGSRDEW
ncbi:hypothetical protein EGW08_021432 [Elysia chlorotica]|uniref:Endonuclease-reverse transcriptase n=1 Tax=Elysia chlorotica TaxID=188477 RepID=A0A433SNT6_ELYCH|nr:hypothetical protein EGW08_021432 [Elysia chlorotica]